MTLTETPRHTARNIAERVAAHLRAQGFACRVIQKPVMGLDGETVRFDRDRATVAVLGEGGRIDGFANDTIYDFEQAAERPQQRMAA